MSDELNESQSTLNSDNEQAEASTSAEVSTDQEVEPVESTEEVDIEELKAKAAKAEEYKTFAERTKIELKELKKKFLPKTSEATSSSPETLPITDIVALSKINEDDIPEVVDYAKFKGIPVKEALKTNVIKTLLAEKEEERKTAQATATGTQKRGTAKPNDEALLERAITRGELPDNDSDIARIVKLRKGLK